MKIKTFVNQVAEENTYLLTSELGNQLLIDPGSDKNYLDEIKNLQAILLTHAHFDHILGLTAVADEFPEAQIWLAESEKDWPVNPELNGSRLMMGLDFVTKEATNYYNFEKNLTFDGFELSVLATPGHSIGGVTFVFESEKVIFSGDALFKSSIGRTDLATGNFEQLIQSIKTQILTFPDVFEIYPGHGPKTDIATEKKENPFLLNGFMH